MTVIEDVIRDLLRKRRRGEELAVVRPLKGGVNSLVYKVITEKGSEYLAKKYLIRKGDTRDRLSTEFYGISFLWDNGIRSIPEPICLDREHGIGIYGFIKGKRLKPGEVTKQDVNSASEFSRSLHSLVNAKGADKQPIASEACFTVKAYMDCVEDRLKNLRVVRVGNGMFKRLHIYLDKEFLPYFNEIKQFVRLEASRRNIDMNREIKTREKTLSPSDFGFHNAIRREDGSLVFLDFEYYGWDDPAKMIADFYLQPALPVPSVYRETFFESVYQCLGKDSALMRRLPLVYIILGLKWCMIMLNVFLRSDPDTVSNEEIFNRQLEKARSKLNETRREMESKTFPLSLL